MATQYTEEFKKDAVKYWKEHTELGIAKCAKNLRCFKKQIPRMEKRLPSGQEKREEQIKERIIEIYQESHQNYGVPKIAECLRREGEKIADKTMGNYMRELGVILIPR